MFQFCGYSTRKRSFYVFLDTNRFEMHENAMSSCRNVCGRHVAGLLKDKI